MHRLQPLLRVFTHPSPAHGIEALGIIAVAASLCFLLARLSPATILSLGVGSEAFSGDWKYMHIPVPLDRLLFILGLGLLLFGGLRKFSDRRLIFSPIHLLLLAIVIYAALSAFSAGTLTTSIGFYALLDRLGLIPFLMFTLAPVVFRSAKARHALLVVMVVLGIYLGITALMEGVGLLRYVEPSYIRNPNIGIHYGRARGPFLESVADGFSMFICAVAAAVALTTWRARWARIACIATIVLSGAGVIFTLTRSVWVAAAVGALVPAIYDRRIRRFVPALVIVGSISVYLIITYVPGLGSKVQSRVSTQSSVWDRYNTNDAALRAWKAHPITGIGWETFITKGPDYLRQAATYPLTGVGLEVHNVFLSHLVELGVPGALMWVIALFSGVGGAAIRRGPSDLYPWRLGLMAIFAGYLVAANLGPFSYPLPNLVMWMWAGIVAAERYSTLRALPPSLAAGALGECQLVEEVQDLGGASLVELAAKESSGSRHLGNVV